MTLNKVVSSLFIVLSLFSCVNSRSPVRPGETIGSTPGGEVTPGPGEALELEIMVVGLGVAKVIDKAVAKSFARNNALGAIAQQASGLTFLYNIDDNMLKLKSLEEEQTLTGVERKKEGSFQVGKSWVAYSVLRTLIKVKMPEDVKSVTLTAELEVESLEDPFAAAGRKALEEWREVIRGVIPEGTPGDIAGGVTSVRGLIYFTGLEIDYDVEMKIYTIRVEMQVYYE